MDRLAFVGFVALWCFPNPAHLATADDWPMWRHDAGRTNFSHEGIPDRLHLQWKIDLPPVKPAFSKSRLQFDAGYEPIISGDTLFVAVPHMDAVVAYDSNTGVERWRFYTDGPVRLAPVAWDGKLYFGSDDGCLYCLDALSGDLKWKFRAVPSSRKILGNGRLISVWPIRGGPVLTDETVYFAAGVWPLEGVFVYALNALTGEVQWVNDRCGTLYGKQPHAGAEALGGLTPQGYLLVNGDDLLVPCGAAKPATFNRHTGDLVEFTLPSEGRLPGGWFMQLDPQVARDLRRGKVQFDSVVNRDLHEGGPNIGKGVDGSRTQITLDGNLLNYADGVKGVEGEIHSMAMADGRLYVTNLTGTIYCFGSSDQAAISRPVEAAKQASTKDLSHAVDDRLRKFIESTDGYAIVLGTRTGVLAEYLARSTDLRVIALADSDANVNAIRQRTQQPHLSALSMSVIEGDLEELALPQYLANLIVAEDWSTTKIHTGEKYLVNLYDRLKPYGGIACIETSSEQDDLIRNWLHDAGHSEAQVERQGDFLVIRRAGALPGAVNYNNDWMSPDKLVRAPLGILWFEDTDGRFKRAPQPSIVDGVMISQDKDWQGETEKMGATQHMHREGTGRFRLLDATFTDVYTGRSMSLDEADSRLAQMPEVNGRSFHPPYQFRPPYVEANLQELESKGEKPKTYPFRWQADKGKMKNPLTGLLEPRCYVKSYGCDGGVDYGHLITMRSATPAFYDKGYESGTINIAGPRSGCTNSIIPANGVLSLPYFYEGCTCSYPLPTGAALVNMPQTFEQWTAWGQCVPKSIVRVGVNLGAPGDRITHAGTLFVDHPSVGGPSPEIKITTVPDVPDYYYHHSLFTKGGTGWPWVCASGAQGIESLTLSGLDSGKFNVRLYFAEPLHDEAGRRVFDVSLQGKTVLKGFDIFQVAGGKMKCVVKEFTGIQMDGSCEIVITALQGKGLLSGIEIVSSDLVLDALSEMEVNRKP